MPSSKIKYLHGSYPSAGPTRIGGQMAPVHSSLLAAVLDADAARQATPALPVDWQGPAPSKMLSTWSGASTSPTPDH